MKNLFHRLLSSAKLVEAIGLPSYAKLTLSSVALVDRQVRLRIDGYSVWVRAATNDVAVALDSLRTELEPLRDLLPPAFDGLIVDAGGYIGTAALKLANMYPKATVVTIEPSSDNLKVLCANVAGIPRIVVIRAALVPAQAGKVTLKDRGTGHWGYTIVNQPQDMPAAQSVEEVAAITLEEVSERFQGKPIGILKLDIEGAEKALFDHGGALLEEVPIVFAELHDRIVEGCTASFERYCSGRWRLKPHGKEKFVTLRKL